jgi:peptidoglycan/xylan/chitin deacetylase (PgdA/CDA1 family)
MNILNTHTSILLKSLVLTRRMIYGILHIFDILTRQSTSVFVLSYHSFANDNWPYTTPLSELKKQLIHLQKNGYQFISVEDLISGIKKNSAFKKAVVLTIDDGYKDTMETVELLKKLDIPATLFILSDGEHINRKEVATNKELMTKQQIEHLIKNNWVIGSHSATHANLAELSLAELNKEIVDSKNILEKKYGLKISHFAFPRGKYNTEVLKTVKKAGYTAAFTMDDGFISKQTKLLQIPRVGVNRTHSLQEFKTIYSPSVIKMRMAIKHFFK